MRRFRDIHLFNRLTACYLLWAVFLWVAYDLVPDLHRHLPPGLVENLVGAEEDPTGFIGLQIYAANVTSAFGGILWLLVAIPGAMADMIPVSWVYTSNGGSEQAKHHMRAAHQQEGGEHSGELE